MSRAHQEAQNLPPEPGDPYGAMDDHGLVERVLAGDDEAFRVLMDRYASMVLGYLSKHVRAYAETDDLLQEVFWAAYRHLVALNQRDKLGPWLLGIAKHKTADLHRRRAAQSRLLGRIAPGPEADWEGPFSRAASTTSPAEAASAAETQDLVLRCLGSLSDRYRTILYMHLIDELEPYEIARRLALKDGTVRVRLMRGLAKLRKTINRESLTAGREGYR